MKQIKKIILFYNSPFIRINLILGFSLMFFSLLMILFSNPFSRLDPNKKVEGVCLPVAKNDINFSVDDYSNQVYEFKDEDYWILNVSNFMEGDSLTVEHWNLKGQGREFRVDISSIENCDNPHPLPFLYSDDGNIFLLGTTPKGDDFCGKLFASFSKTLQLSILTLTSFLLTGISLGIFLGYYKNKFRIIYFIINYFQKMIESVPIILWMIISYAFLSIQLDAWAVYKTEIAFVLFGVFSSTALSKLLVNKFDNFRKEDFIVALKLLGISDRRIIFVHIIKFYCLPLIIMQTIYIFAQCFFMDITLTVLKYGKDGTLGKMFLDFLTVMNNDSTFHFVVMLSIFIYLILSSLFYSSEYLKVVSSHE